MDFGEGDCGLGIWSGSLCKSLTLDEIHYKRVKMTGATWHNSREVRQGTRWDDGDGEA